MKYLLLIIIFAANLILSAQPKLVTEPADTINWGKVKAIESPLKAKLLLKNVGKDSLYIMRVKPGCGCTTSKLNKKNIEPDSSAVVDITLEIPNLPGIFHKVINIKSTDPDQPDKTVHLVADVIFPLIFVPATQFISLPNMTTGKESQGKITIINTTVEDITIKKVSTVPEYIKTDLKDEQILKSNIPLEITVMVTPQKTGILNGALKFKTTHEDVPRVEIPIRGTIIQSSDQPLQKIKK